MGKTNIMRFKVGEILFEKDCERIWLFDRLMWMVLSYGDEGSLEEKEFGGDIQKRYLKWALEVEWRTPAYMMKDLLRAGKLAWNYEKKLREGEGGELAKECWKDTEREYPMIFNNQRYKSIAFHKISLTLHSIFSQASFGNLTMTVPSI